MRISCFLNNVLMNVHAENPNYFFAKCSNFTRDHKLKTTRVHYMLHYGSVLSLSLMCYCIAFVVYHESKRIYTNLIAAW